MVDFDHGACSRRWRASARWRVRRVRSRNSAELQDGVSLEGCLRTRCKGEEAEGTRSDERRDEGACGVLEV